MLREKGLNLKGWLALPTGLALALFLLAFPVAAQDEPAPETEAEPEAPAEGEEAAPEESAPPAEEAPAEEAPAEEVPPVEEPPAEEAPVEEAPAEETPEEEVEPGEVIDETAGEEEVDEGEPEEEIVVTGTRIGRDNLEDYAQITVLTSEDIEMSGVSNIEELLRYMPSVTLGGIKGKHPTGSGFAIVDLRNLGPQRTLTLLNGRRVIGIGASAVDLSNIPVSMIERVEVLLDGASAIYGSDAVAGVVNIITKEDFDGFEVATSGGISTHGDGGRVGVSTTIGANGDKGNVVLNFNWDHRDPVYQRDRSWAVPPCESVIYNLEGDLTSECGSPTVPGGTITYVGVTDPLYNIDYSNGIVFQGHGDEMQFHGMETGYEDWLAGDQAHPYDLYNWGEQMPLMGQVDGFQLLGTGHYELGEFVTAYMEGLYSYRRHGGRYAGEPVRPDSNPLYPEELYLDFSNPFIPDAFWDDIINHYGMSYADPRLAMNKRTNDVGARVFDDTSSTFRAVVGLRGEITQDYTWDVFFNYGRFTDIDITKNSPDMQRFQIAINPELCYATPNCVLVNMFGEGVMQEEARDFIGFDATNIYITDMINSGAQFVMRPFSLPGGKFAAVIGGDLRWERGIDLPDSKTQDGVSGTNTSSETNGGYNVQEGYIEMSAPFLSGLPGAYILTLDLAGRLSHYNTFGTEFTYRAGLSYGPIEDIRFRGVYSTSYRAPSVDELFGGYYTSFPAVQDPCSDYMGNLDELDPYVVSQCEAHNVPETYVQNVTQVRSNNGSNPDLLPETATTVNVGTVIQPTFMPKTMPMSLTFDWYKIWIDDAIVVLGAQDIITKCYEVPSLVGYCDYLTRNEETGNIAEIDVTRRNVAEVTSTGLDFTFQLGFPIFETIRGNLGFQGNVLLQYQEANPDDLAAGMPAEDAEFDYTGTIHPQSAGHPRFRFISNLSFGSHIWQLDNRVRYIHSMDIEGRDESAPYSSLEAVAYWDMAASLSLGDFALVIGCDNVLDREPPYFWGSAYNASVQVYDVIGRYLWTKLSYKFH